MAPRRRNKDFWAHLLEALRFLRILGGVVLPSAMKRNGAGWSGWHDRGRGLLSLACDLALNEIHRYVWRHSPAITRSRPRRPPPPTSKPCSCPQTVGHLSLIGLFCSTRPRQGEKERPNRWAKPSCPIRFSALMPPSFRV